MSRKYHEQCKKVPLMSARIISRVLFFCSAPQAALPKFTEVNKNHLMGTVKSSDDDQNFEFACFGRYLLALEWNEVA